MSEASSSKPGGQTAEVLYTNVPIDLFRMGNASGPKLDNIRDKTSSPDGRGDVKTVEVTTGSGQKVLMVPADGGLSTFDARNPRLKGIWWTIPAGTSLPETIRVVKDYTRWDPVLKQNVSHYSLRPSRLMTLLEYAEGLKEVAKFAVKDAVSITHPADQAKTHIK